MHQSLKYSMAFLRAHDASAPPTPSRCSVLIGKIAFFRILHFFSGDGENQRTAQRRVTNFYDKFVNKINVYNSTERDKISRSIEKCCVWWYESSFIVFALIQSLKRIFMRNPFIFHCLTRNFPNLSCPRRTRLKFLLRIFVFFGNKNWNVDHEKYRFSLF
jgi:hypothetical protein